MGLLAAASMLEQSVNNTSLFFVLDVGGVRLLFPGDAQYGAWESVRNDPKSLDLISNVDFYKMGHHGSHNATPMSFIETQWKKPGDTMKLEVVRNGSKKSVTVKLGQAPGG